MRHIRWAGTAPPRRVIRALEDARFAISRRPAGEDALPAVLFTAVRRVPVAADRPNRWIWLAPTTVGPERARQAALQGAYATVALDEPDAIPTLVARLEELSVPDPVADPPPHIVADSSASRDTVAQVARVAPTSMPVLITGETGTGKEVVARLLHAWSPRQQKRFVPINCAAIPNELMEAELFGYARGAFSGAVQRYDGQLMAADVGTVFLDEIDDTPV
jgi:DNA-binding NtrC family response regulator